MFKLNNTAGLLPVTATLYACRLGQRAYEWEEKEHGVFSYYLLEGLNGKAAAPNGEVTINSLATYTQKHVNRWAMLYRGEEQQPWLSLEAGARWCWHRYKEVRRPLRFQRPRG